MIVNRLILICLVSDSNESFVFFFIFCIILEEKTLKDTIITLKPMQIRTFQVTIA